MQNRKSRVLCFFMALIMIFSCIEIFKENNSYNMERCDVFNRYSAFVTLYDPITTNSEKCTLEMLGTKNTTQFVRSEKRGSQGICLKTTGFIMCEHGNGGCTYNAYSSIYSDNPQNFFGDTLIVDYIHNQDGEK